ncbi:hypothetical protein LZ32DRAFT_195358 [Colletotrichum eremochloae]|nr:hypothetical protein LZ32DRAFT_195358 [Colletotrichum eremochloae]
MVTSTNASATRSTAMLYEPMHWERADAKMQARPWWRGEECSRTSELRFRAALQICAHIALMPRGDGKRSLYKMVSTCMTIGASRSTLRMGGELQLVSIIGSLKALFGSRLLCRTGPDRRRQLRHWQSLRHPGSGRGQALWRKSMVSEATTHLMFNVGICRRGQGPRVEWRYPLASPRD